MKHILTVITAISVYFDCINKPEDLVKQAQKIGLKGICVTDHDCLSSAIELNKLQKKLIDDGSDFKIGLGNEIYLCDTRECNQKYYHFILITKNADGHKALRKLSSKAWMNSYEDRRMERVVTLKEDLKKIVSEYPNSLIATTACLGGELSTKTLLMEEARRKNDEVLANKYKAEIISFVLFMKELFGDDFILRLRRVHLKTRLLRIRKLRKWAWLLV